MDKLAKVMGGLPRLKLMRLFLFNPQSFFDEKTLARRTQLTPAALRQELQFLYTARLIRKKSRVMLNKVKTKTKKSSKKTKKQVRAKAQPITWVLNANFPFWKELTALMTAVAPMGESALVNKFEKLGRMKLLVTAGIFTGTPESSLDVLIVADHLPKNMVDRVMNSLEAEMGRELRYAAFETSEFLYRLNLYDRLLRDVFDFQHKILLDKLHGSYEHRSPLYPQRAVRTADKMLQ